MGGFPGGPLRRILEHDALCQQLIADAVGLGEIARLLGGRARCDLCLDFGLVTTRSRLKETTGSPCNKPNTPPRPLSRPASAAERVRFTSLASSNSTATASGVPKSSSIAALNRAAAGWVQSMATSAGATRSSAV